MPSSESNQKHADAPEAEARIIGSVLIDPEVLPQVLQRLRPEHFHDPKHILLFHGFVELASSGHPVSSVTMADWLRQRGSYGDAGGAQYLMGLMQSVATTEPTQIDHYCRMITDRYLVRRLVSFGQELISHSESTQNPHELIKISTETLAKMNGSIGAGDARITQSSIRGDQLIDKEVRKPASIVGDGIMTESSFVLLYGKPGLGKTWLALQLAFSVALGRPWLGIQTQKRRVGIIELEMHEYYLRERLSELASRLEPDDAREALSNIDIIIRPNYTGVIDLMEDTTRDGISNWVQDKGVGMLLLDALSRMHFASENNAQEIGRVLSSIERIRDETSAGIMGIHHEPKEGAKGKKDEVSDLDAARGSSRFQSDPHTMMRLRIWAGRPVIVFAKMNLGPALEPIFLKRNPGGGYEATDDPNPDEIREKNLLRVEELMVEAGISGLTTKAVAEQTGLSARTAKKYLDQVCHRVGNNYIHKSLTPGFLPAPTKKEEAPQPESIEDPKDDPQPEEPPQEAGAPEAAPEPPAEPLEEDDGDDGAEPLFPA